MKTSDAFNKSDVARLTTCIIDGTTHGTNYRQSIPVEKSPKEAPEIEGFECLGKGIICAIDGVRQTGEDKYYFYVIKK